MNVYLVCFDISDDRSRRRVSRRLEHFGLRVQRSVFEISTKNRQEVNSLRDELAKFLEGDDDLRFYNLCRSCRIESHDHLNERVAQFPTATIV